MLSKVNKTMELYSAIKNEIVICRKMDGTGEDQVKRNKPNSERQLSFSHILETKGKKRIS